MQPLRLPVIETYQTYTEPVQGNCSVCDKTLNRGRVVTANHPTVEHPPIHAHCVEKILQRRDGANSSFCQLCRRAVDLNSLNGNFENLRDNLLSGALSGSFVSALIKGMGVALPLLSEKISEEDLLFISAFGIGAVVDTLLDLKKMNEMPLPLEYLIALAAISYELGGVEGAALTWLVSSLIWGKRLFKLLKSTTRSHSWQWRSFSHRTMRGLIQSA